MQVPVSPKSVQAGTCQQPENKNRHGILKLCFWILHGEPEKEE